MTIKNQISFEIISKNPIFIDQDFTKIKFKEDISIELLSSLQYKISEVLNKSGNYYHNGIGLLGDIDNIRLDNLISDLRKEYSIQSDYDIIGPKKIDIQEDKDALFLFALKIRSKLFRNMGCYQFDMYHFIDNNPIRVGDQHLYPIMRTETDILHDGRVSIIIQVEDWIYLTLDSVFRMNLLKSNEIISEEVLVPSVKYKKWMCGKIIQINENGLSNKIPDSNETISEIWTQDKYLDFISNWHIDVLSDDKTVRVKMSWGEDIILEYPITTALYSIESIDIEGHIEGNFFSLLENSLYTLTDNLLSSSIKWFDHEYKFIKKRKEIID